MEKMDNTIAEVLNSLKTRTEACLETLKDINAQCCLMSYIIFAREMNDETPPTE